MQAVVGALGRLEWDSLSRAQRLHLLRVYQVAFSRLGPPTSNDREAVIERLNPHLPATDPATNLELAQVLVYLQAPKLASRLLALLQDAPTQEEQIALAKTMRLFANRLDERRP